MKRKNKIKNAAICAVFAALSVVLLFFGTMLDILDLTVAAACSIISLIVLSETGTRYALLMYFASSVLAFLFMTSSSAVIYYISFFGYYPILCNRLSSFPKIVSKLLSFAIFNAIMVADFLIFTKIFGIAGEPWWMYIALAATGNIFFAAYDYALPVFRFIYEKKLKKKFRF